MQGVTKSERNKEDYKGTGFKEAKDDNWNCILILKIVIDRKAGREFPKQEFQKKLLA